MFLPGVTNTQLALSYVSYGVHCIWSVGSVTELREYFLYGLQSSFDISSFPRTGTASYSGVAEGTFFDGAVPYRLTGTSGFTANFAAGSVGMTLDLIGQTAVTNAPAFAPVHYEGTGSIKYPPYVGTDPIHYSGTMTSPADVSYNGTFQGAFYGPSAREYGLTFNINQKANPAATKTGVAVGVAVGK